MIPKHAHYINPSGLHEKFVPPEDSILGSINIINHSVGSSNELHLHNGRLDIHIFNSAIVDAIKFTYKEPFEPLFEKGAHSGSILALALTPTKTICGTLSSDKKVKFWNFSADQKLI